MKPNKPNRPPIPREPYYHPTLVLLGLLLLVSGSLRSAEPEVVKPAPYIGNNAVFQAPWGETKETLLSWEIHSEERVRYAKVELVYQEQRYEAAVKVVGTRSAPIKTINATFKNLEPGGPYDLNLYFSIGKERRSKTPKKTYTNVAIGDVFAIDYRPDFNVAVLNEIRQILERNRGRIRVTQIDFGQKEEKQNTPAEAEADEKARKALDQDWYPLAPIDVLDGSVLSYFAISFCAEVQAFYQEQTNGSRFIGLIATTSAPPPGLTIENREASDLIWDEEARYLGTLRLLSAAYSSTVASIRRAETSARARYFVAASRSKRQGTTPQVEPPRIRPSPTRWTSSPNEGLNHQVRGSFYFSPPK